MQVDFRLLHVRSQPPPKKNCFNFDKNRAISRACAVGSISSFNASMYVGRYEPLSICLLSITEWVCSSLFSFLTLFFLTRNILVRVPTYLGTSVTRLGNFLTFLVTLFLIKVGQIFADFRAIFKMSLLPAIKLKWIFLGQLLQKLGYFLCAHLVTLQ